MKSYKCICQLCSCGKHSCPKPPKPKGEIFPHAPSSVPTSTEYKTIFQKHTNVTPRENFKPPQKAMQRDTPMSCYTTNRADFIPHSVAPPVSRPPTVYKKPDGCISSESEYLKEYQYKECEPVQPIVPHSSQVRTTAEKFNFKSTQASDFKPFVVQPRVVYGENRKYQPPTEKFEAKSTFQTDFKGEFPTDFVTSLKPTQETQLSRDAFQGSSCYNSDFKHFQLPDRYHHQKEPYKPPTEKFEGVSSFANDYPGYRGVSPAQSLKPPMTAKASNHPLESTTTNRVSYQKWQLPPRFSRPPTSYEPPKQKFATTTVFIEDFASPGLQEPVPNFKPKHQPIKVTTPFNHQTVNKTDYKPIDLSLRTPLVVKERKYVQPDEKFDGKSTTSTAYQGVYTPPATSTKPQLKPYNKGVKFDETSTYKLSYIRPTFKPDNITCCIGSNPLIPGHTFSYQDPKSGHRFYIPVPKPPTPPSLPSVVAQPVQQVATEA